MIDYSTGFLLALAVFFVLLSAYLAAAEIAIVSASPAKLYRAKTSGDKRAIIALALHADREKLFGCILLLYNLTTIAASTLTTTIMIGLFGDSADVITLVTIGLTIFIVIYGEMMPKTYAVRDPERLALSSAKLFSWLITVLKPIIIVLQWVVEKSFWILGSNSKHRHNISAMDTIRGTIDFHHGAGEVVHEDRYMLGGIIDLNQVTVEQVMIHRNDMQSLCLDDNIKRLLSIASHSQHSRFPLWQGNIDNIIGVIHAKDILKIIDAKGAENITHEDIKLIARDPWFVPDSTTLKYQLQQFRERKQHFAMVVDEYGDMKGILTLEDIIEEVVGQIEDEYDGHNEDKILMNQNGSVYVAGELTIRDLNRQMHWEIPDKDALTIGGLMLHLSQGFPEIGAEFIYHNYHLRFVKKLARKLGVVEVMKISSE